MTIAQQIAHNAVLPEFMSNTDIDAKIAVNEKAIQDLQAQINVYRFHRNHNQAISRLPHELLGYIFELTSDTLKGLSCVPPASTPCR